MSDVPSITIYGKDTWPYTSEAREAYAGRGYAVDYRNAKASKTYLDEMLKLTGGDRRVPVLVESGRVTIGYGGTW